jgi:hypothetical protein
MVPKCGFRGTAAAVQTSLSLVKHILNRHRGPAFDRKRAQKRRYLYRLFSPGPDPDIGLNPSDFKRL